MAYSIFLQLFKEFLAALGIEMVNAGASVARDHGERFRISLEKQGNEGTTTLFQMAEDHDFVLKALVGLWAMELLDDLPVKADSHGGALRVFDGDHGVREKVKEVTFFFSKITDFRR